MLVFIRKFLVLLFLSMYCGIYAQNIDPLIVIDSAQNKLDNIRSYSADAIIDIDVDFLQMKPKNAKIEYEYPNKLKVDAKGFSMIPKYGLRPFMKTISKADNMVLFAGMEEVNGNNCYLIKLLPSADGKIIMIKLWIREDNYLVARTETFTRKSGSFLIDFNYDNLVLPSSLVFSFEVQGLNIPWKFVGNSIEINDENLNDDNLKSGKVFIKFSNYDVKFNK